MVDGPGLRPARVLLQCFARSDHVQFWLAVLCGPDCTVCSEISLSGMMPWSTPQFVSRPGVHGKITETTHNS